MATRLRRALRVSVLSLLMLATLAMPTAWSAEPQVGVVTMLLGTATVARAALSEPAPLTFKGDVFLRDRITTAEKSAVRVLLGGKATVTAREGRSSRSRRFRARQRCSSQPAGSPWPSAKPR